MRISVFAVECNPAIDAPFIRKSLGYCQTEVRAGRARRLHDDIRGGIQLKAPSEHSEARGSREQRSCLKPHEMEMNTESRGRVDERASEELIEHLSGRYEIQVEKHILRGYRGLPHSCGVIAARVKTLLSEPKVRVATT